MPTNKATTIVEKYRICNRDQRIALFLGYPELRSDFLSIEMARYLRMTSATPDMNRTGPARRKHPVLTIGAGLKNLAWKIWSIPSSVWLTG